MNSEKVDAVQPCAEVWHVWRVLEALSLLLPGSLLLTVCLSDDREDFKQRRTTSRTKVKQGLDTRIFWEIHVAGIGRLWGARKGKERRETPVRRGKRQAAGDAA